MIRQKIVHRVNHAFRPTHRCVVHQFKHQSRSNIYAMVNPAFFKPSIDLAAT
jgi:hypothetical protein